MDISNDSIQENEIIISNKLILLLLERKLILIIYLLSIKKMTSYLIDKLEVLKEDENRIKEEQRILHEEIELEIEKKRRLELDGTITKLLAQVGEIAKNIEGKIMRDNFPLLREQETTDYQKACDKFVKDVNQGLIGDEEQIERKKCIDERKQKEDKKYSEWMCRTKRDGNDTKITLEKFKDNLSKVRQEMKDRWRGNRGLLAGGFSFNSYVEIPQEIKIYDDIIPIFTTMIGIMKKQEFEIDNLKQKMGNI